MTRLPDAVRDPDSDLRRRARENVADFPPLTAEQLSELGRLFAGTQTVQPATRKRGESAVRGGGPGSLVPVSSPGAGAAPSPARHRNTPTK